MLQAADVTFAYARDRTPALDAASIAVAPGALVGVLGPNGSGKTTLMRLLCGTLVPQAGRVTLDGEVVSKIPRAALARRLAVVPQETQLAFEYTVLEIVLMGRYPHLGAFEIEGPDDLAAAMDALEATGTRHLAERSFQTLSGGEKQRVIIASALAQLDDRRAGIGHRASGKTHGAPSTAHRAPGALRGSRLLFLDEPTASLDLRYQVEMAGLIRRLHDRQHIAIVLSTHDLHFAAAVCAEVVLLREGRVLARGPTREVLTPEAVGGLYDLDIDTLGRWLAPGPASILSGDTGLRTRGGPTP